MTTSSGGPTDSGNAIIEFVVAGVLLLVPLVLGAASFSVVHVAEMTMNSAVREGARAYSRQATHAQGVRAAQQVVSAVATDQHLPGPWSVRVRCLGGCTDLRSRTAARVSVEASVRVQVPLLSMARTVAARHVLTVRLA